jgi:hypothetical protein
VAALKYLPISLAKEKKKKLKYKRSWDTQILEGADLDGRGAIARCDNGYSPPEHFTKIAQRKP